MQEIHISPGFQIQKHFQYIYIYTLPPINQQKTSHLILPEIPYTHQFQTLALIHDGIDP